jgi:carbonic anhydrase
MSCPNAKSPLDIPTTTANICVEKCNLVFKYGTSSTTISNKKDYVSLGYDASNTNVYYNTIKMEVTDIRIYSPSLHSYNGKKTEAEMIIVHSGFGENLLVCMPIKSTGTDTLSILDGIVDHAKTKIPDSGDATVINSMTWSLNDMVPHQKPMFVYTAPLPYTPCSGVYNYLVWNVNDYFIPVSTKFIASLQGVISKHQYSIKTGPMIYYNKKGAINSSFAGDNNDIYISCQPTGDEGEVLYTKNVSSYNSTSGDGGTKTVNNSLTPQDILANPATEVIIGVLATLLIFKVGEMIYNKVKSKTS